MFKYILFSVIFILSGCVEKRVIQISSVDRDSIYRGDSSRYHRTSRPRVQREEVVKEEILIKNNPNLENIKVLVPKNRPTLDVNISSKFEESNIGWNSNMEHKIVERVDFPEDEYINLPKVGDNEVSGRVYLINSNTDDEIAKRGLKLYLNPVTSYSKQWYEESYLNGHKMTPPDRRLFNYLRYTMSEDNGNFNFFGVPSGRYYLGVRIDCGKECGFSSKRIIRVVKEIYVDGNLNDIELSKVIP
jgi:hypothetical protein